MKSGLSLFVAALVIGFMPVLAQADRYDRGDRYDHGRSHYRGDRSRSNFSFSFGFGSGGFREHSYGGFSYSRYPAPVYVRPAPVIIAPPPVVYYEPAPVVYGPPVVYQPARVYYHSEPYYREPSYRPYRSTSNFHFSGGYYYGR